MKNNDNNKEKSLINMLPMGLSGEINEIWVSLTIDKYCLTVQQIWNIQGVPKETHFQKAVGATVHWQDQK